MSALSIPVVVMASITFFMGVYSLMIHLRRHSERADLSFALTCFGVCLYDVFCAGLYNATSVEQGVFWQQWQLVTLATIGIFWLHFVADYTGMVSKRWLWVLTVLLTILAAAEALGPSHWSWIAEEPSIKRFGLPWLGSITYYEGSSGPLVGANTLAGIVIFAYLFIAAIRYSRSGQRRRARALIIGMGLFSAGFFNDVFITMGIYQFIYVTEYAYMGIVLMFSLSLSNEVVEASIVRQERSRLEERLRQAQKMEAVGRLAGGIAHDLNNMLTPIIGYADIAARRECSPEQLHRYFERIRDVAEHAQELTGQLLAFGRKQVLRMKVLDLNAVIRRSETMIRPLIREDIQISVTLGDDLESVRADETQLQQILINLVLNARDALPRGGAIGIRTSKVVLKTDRALRHSEIQAGPYVMLAVSDTGDGMDSETARQVFEPFFTTKDKWAGTGLGLSTVYGIVKQHGGHIDVVSELKKGSTFEVYLPMVAQPPEPLDDVIQPQTANSGREIVLVVEDEQVVREMASEALSNAGYEVHTAQDGEEGLEMMNRLDKRVDLLLTDVVMPNMDGRELYDTLLQRHERLAVLFMSGYTDDVIAPKGVLEEDVAFLQKPFSVEALLTAVRTVLDRTGSTDRD